MFLGLDRQDSDSVAFEDNHGQLLTYGQLVEEILKIQKQLHGRALAFCLCQNNVGCALGYLALVDAGVVPIMLSANLNESLFRSLFEEYQPNYIWAPCGIELFFEGDVVYSAFSYSLFETMNSSCDMHESLQLCMPTSGSTGSPKLVRYKVGNLEANAKNVAQAFGWTSDERAFADLGLQYTMGLNVVNTHLYVGATVLLCDANLLTNDYWDFMKGKRATNITGVPFTYDIFARLRFTKKDLPFLKTIAEGGGKLSDKRFSELATYAHESGRRFFATFGTTETAARLSYLDPALAQEKIGSIGKAIPGGEMYLRDKDGAVLEEKVAEGELCYKGPNVTMGYAMCRGDLSLGDEWNGIYATGDLARRDEDGCYFITGRLSRFLKLLGHRVSLDQCERILRDDLGVAAACVGDDSKMIVYVEQPSDSGRCVRYLSEKLRLRLSLFEERSIDIIPRNETGKIVYGSLL